MPRHLPNQAPPADCLTIPYSAIIRLIPQELWGKLAPAGVAGYNHTIARKTVLEQIPHGSVKVSFGELRRGAPAGVFITTPAEDTRMVDLPLSEILAQMHPDTFARRPDQARVEVSNEVPDLFGAKGQRLGAMRVMEKKEASTVFTRQNVSTAGGTRPPMPTAPAPAPPLSLPNLMPTPSGQPASAAANAPLRMPAAPPSSGAKPAWPIPFPIPKPAGAAGQPARPLPASLPRPVASAPAPQQVSSANFSGGFFFIGLDEVAENWPDGVRQELAQLKIPNARVALPPVEICEGLKRGRIQYPWRTLRSWIQPTPIYASPSPHDDQMLELPLRSLTPLFLDHIRANPVNRQAADAENITEFFRKAEQASGTSPELLQPLFETSPAHVSVAPARAPAAPAPAPAAPAHVSAPPAPAPAPAPEGAPSLELVIEHGLLCVPLAMLSSAWPEPIVRDIAQFGLSGSRVDIPLTFVEPGLKSGRLEFTWRDICSWLNPESKPAQISINAETRVSLPLGLIAPLFLKHRDSIQGRRRTTVSESIPDLFSAAGKPLAPPVSAPQGAVAPAPAPAPVPAPAPAPAPAPSNRVQSSEAPAPTSQGTSQPAVQPPPYSAGPLASATPPAPAAGPARKVPTTLSELFSEPTKKSWTPNEIVQRTAHLSNVAGSLIALQDGLLVASNMPPALKTETIAAFVPQIFGRLNQYSKELQLGETTAVSFTVAMGTVQVYNAGIIYFAVLGKPGTVLPHTDLQLIATELSRHTK